MKTTIRISAWIFVLFVAFHFNGCKKEKDREPEPSASTGNPTNPPSVSYPAVGYHGVNILALNDNDTVIEDTVYSFAAQSVNGGKVIITMTNKSPVSGEQISIWGYDISTEDHWTISDYDDGTGVQTFELAAGENGDLELSFLLYGAGYGAAEMKIEELNTGKEVVTKTIFWKR